MSTIVFTQTDGSTYEVDSNTLARKQAFEAIRDGRMSFDDFDSWADELRDEGYSDGSNVVAEWY